MHFHHRLPVILNNILSQAEVFSIVCSMTNLDAGMLWCHIFRRIFILFTSSWWLHPCLVAHHGTCQPWSTMPTCIQHHHTNLSPEMIVQDAIGYTSWSPFVCIDGTYSNCCISVFLRSVALPFVQDLWNATFQQDICTATCQNYSDLPRFKKCFAAILASLFSKSFTNRKYLVSSCQMTGLSSYNNHHCHHLEVASCWSFMSSCTCASGVKIRNR